MPGPMVQVIGEIETRLVQIDISAQVSIPLDLETLLQAANLNLNRSPSYPVDFWIILFFIGESFVSLHSCSGYGCEGSSFPLGGVSSWGGHAPHETAFLER